MPETVSIITEADVHLPVAPGVSKAFRAITYVATGQGPRIVYVDPAEDTTAKRQELIAADLKEARAAKPNTLALS
jgi:hypothetical protein